MLLEEQRHGRVVVVQAARVTSFVPGLLSVVLSVAVYTGV